jgi:hypothetical protein
MNRFEPIAIIPYRDRQEHLSRFLSHMQQYYSAMPICIVEQSNGKPFNRGKLLNIGYIENPGCSHYVFHDVDMLPLNVNYATKRMVSVVQLANSDIQLFGYLGGVTRFSAYAFRNAGGYHNDYFHRAEDNEMAFNLKRLDISVVTKPGNYFTLDHERKGPEFDPALWLKAQAVRTVQNQLSACSYEVIHSEEIANVKHIVVNC